MHKILLRQQRNKNFFHFALKVFYGYARMHVCECIDIPLLYHMSRVSAFMKTALQRNQNVAYSSKTPKEA